MDNAVCHKTVRSLGSKFASLVLSMTYLTVWHGLHAGYFLTFIATELLLFVMERLSLEYASSEYVQFDSLSTVSKGLLMAAGYIWMWTALGYAVVPFEQKRLDRRLKALKMTRFFFQIVFLVWIACVVVCMILSRLLGIKETGTEILLVSENSIIIGFSFTVHILKRAISITEQLGLQGQTVNRMRLQQCSIYRDSSDVSPAKKDD